MLKSNGGEGEKSEENTHKHMKRSKIFLYQERWLKFTGEYSNTRGILNFSAERIQ